MKRVVDIFNKDWSHEILWTYIIELENSEHKSPVSAFEDAALFLAITENRGDASNIFARARE